MVRMTPIEGKPGAVWVAATGGRRGSSSRERLRGSIRPVFRNFEQRTVSRFEAELRFGVKEAWIALDNAAETREFETRKDAVIWLCSRPTWKVWTESRGRR